MEDERAREAEVLSTNRHGTCLFALALVMTEWAGFNPAQDVHTA